MTPEERFAEFLGGAVAAKLWATFPLPPDDDGLCLAPADEYDMAPGQGAVLQAAMAHHARRFFASAYPYLLAAVDHLGEGWAEAGHCFALDADGHGSGFADRPIPDHIAEVLTDEARRYEQAVGLYVEDDGLLYCDDYGAGVGEGVALGLALADALGVMEGAVEQWAVLRDGAPPRAYGSEEAAEDGLRATLPRDGSARVAWRLCLRWREVPVAVACDDMR